MGVFTCTVAQASYLSSPSLPPSGVRLPSVPDDMTVVYSPSLLVVLYGDVDRCVVRVITQQPLHEHECWYGHVSVGQLSYFMRHTGAECLQLNFGGCAGCVSGACDT